MRIAVLGLLGAALAGPASAQSEALMDAVSQAVQRNVHHQRQLTLAVQCHVRDADWFMQSVNTLRAHSSNSARAIASRFPEATYVEYLVGRLSGTLAGVMYSVQAEVANDPEGVCQRFRAANDLQAVESFLAEEQRKINQGR